MHIAFIAPHGIACGIASYTEELASALQKNEVTITILSEGQQFTNTRLAVNPQYTINTIPCWNRQHPSTEMLLQQIDQLKPDIIHIQHEFGLWPVDSTLWQLLYQIEQRKIPVCMTIHSAIPPDVAKRGFFFQTACRLSKWLHIIAHSVESITALTAFPISSFDSIHLIPHGTPIHTMQYTAEQRKAFCISIGIKNVLTCLAFGFLSPNKSIETAIRATANVLTIPDFPSDFQLHIVGAYTDPLYIRRLEDCSQQTGFGGNIRISPKYIPFSEIYKYIATSDFAFIGRSSQLIYSASGIVHLLAGYGMPFICADVPIHNDIPWNCACRFVTGPDLTDEINSATYAMALLSKSEKFRNYLHDNVSTWANTMSWDNIIKQYYLPLYKDILA